MANLWLSFSEGGSKDLHNRKDYLFAGSNAGGERAATVYSLIGTAKLNDLDPEAYSWPLETTMYFKQFYMGCLAHASYLIGPEAEAGRPGRCEGGSELSPRTSCE